MRTLPGIVRRIARLAAVGFCVAMTSAAFAQSVNPQRSPGDPRLRIVAYRENQVVLLRGYLGYQMMIEFDRAEQIENVAVGDSLGWQVTPNRAATLLFVKPLVVGAATNMSVVTNLRRYNFELVSREATGSDDPRIMYTVRFTYPAPPTALAKAPPRDPALDATNRNYRFSGARTGRPVRVFDNGRATFFQFSERADTPAIFVVGPDGKEEIVNSQARGPYIVVDQIAQAFSLRSGAQRVGVRNDGYREPSPEPARRKQQR